MGWVYFGFELHSGWFGFGSDLFWVRFNSVMLVFGSGRVRVRWIWFKSTWVYLILIYLSMVIIRVISMSVKSGLFEFELQSSFLGMGWVCSVQVTIGFHVSYVGSGMPRVVRIGSFQIWLVLSGLHTLNTHIHVKVTGDNQARR